MSHLICLIPCCCEEVAALLGIEQVADVADRHGDGVEGSGGLLAQQGLELRERHFDRIEVGRVGRQEEEPGAALAHQFGGALALVEADIVEDDHVAPLQFGCQLRLDVAFEDLAVHRALDDPWSDEAVTAQAGDEGLRAPVPEGRMRQIALPLRRPAGALGQLGVGRGLVDEDEAGQGFGEERLSAGRPEFPRGLDVRPQLLAGAQSFFCG